MLNFLIIRNFGLSEIRYFCTSKSENFGWSDLIRNPIRNFWWSAATLIPILLLNWWYFYGISRPRVPVIKFQNLGTADFWLNFVLFIIFIHNICKKIANSEQRFKFFSCNFYLFLNGKISLAVMQHPFHFSQKHI